MSLNTLSLVVPQLWPLAGLDTVLKNDAGTVAMGNLMRGDTSGAAEASVYPEQALPIQTLTAYEQFKASRGEPVEDSWTDRVKKFLFNISTDPILLTAVAVAGSFSPLHAVAGRIPTYLKKLHQDLGPMERWLVGMDKLLNRKDPTGTLVPLSTVGVLRMQKFQDHFANRYFQAVEPLWKENRQDNMHILASLLDGRDPGLPVTPAHQDAALKVRQLFDEMGDLIQLPKEQRISDYLPHIFPGVGMNDIIEPNTINMYNAIRKNRTYQVYSQGVLGDDLPFLNVEDLQKLRVPITKFGDIVNNRKGPWYEGKVARQIFNQFLIPRKGAETVEVAGYDMPYTLNLDEIMKQYVRRAGRTYGFNTVINNDALFPEMQELLPYLVLNGRPVTPEAAQSLRAPILTQLNAIDDRFFRGTIPGKMALPATHQVYSEYQKMILGHYTEADSTMMQYWNNIRLDLYDKLSGVLDKIPANTTAGKWMRSGLEWLKAPTETLSFPRVQNMVTSYLTCSALGMNPASAFMNLLQTPVTTLNTIGFRGTYHGLKEAFSRLKQYYTMKTNGISNEIAAEQSFGDYLQWLGTDPKTFNLAVLGKDNLDVMTAHSHIQNMASKAGSWLMFPFTEAERFNHLVSFYGSNHLLNDPEVLKKIYPEMLDVAEPLRKAWANFASGQITANTQFVPRPGTQPMILRKGPLGLGMTRQFFSFPLRFTSWMTDSFYTGQWERAENGEWSPNTPTLAKLTGGRNLGTYARLIAGSTVLNRFFKDVVGVDVSRGLGGSVVPDPSDDTPFAPLPMAPAPSIFFTTADSVARGDFKNMKKVWPLLVPGGVALNKAIRQQDRMTTEGYYDEFGRRIQDHSPVDSLLEMNFGPTVKSQREYLAIKQTENVRQVTQDLRRRYSLAAARGDTQRMGEVSMEWKKRFPQLPSIQVSRQDIDRAKLATLETRLQRQLKSSGTVVQGAMNSFAAQDSENQQQFTPFTLFPQF